MTKIITTVGTSIFTNYQDDKVRYHYGKEDYQALTNYPELKDKEARFYFNSQYKHFIDDIKENIKDFWFEYKKEANENASAEIKSIIDIVDELEHKENVTVHLISTDTLVSLMAAELILEWFELHRSDININFKKPSPNFSKQAQTENDYIIRQLNIYSQTDYDQGFMNLITVLDKIASENDILNITGGYKAIIPIMTLFSQIRNTTLKYKYDETDTDKTSNLVTINKMPLNFDWTLLSSNTYFITDLTRINSENKRKELEQLGILKRNSFPLELTPLGYLFKLELEKDPPYQRDMMGYFVEYKFYEFYQKNIYSNYSKIFIGKDIGDSDEKDLDDVDLWMENPQTKEVTAAEIKPMTIHQKSLRRKIVTQIRSINQISPLLKEFWILLYEREGVPTKLNNDVFQNIIQNYIVTEFPQLIVKFKKIIIQPNLIDGYRNRMKYHEFLRGNIENIIDLLDHIPNQQ